MSTITITPSRGPASQIQRNDAEDAALDEALEVQKNLNPQDNATENAPQEKPSKSSRRSRSFRKKPSSKRAGKNSSERSEQNRQDSQSERDGTSGVRDGMKVSLKCLKGIEELSDKEKQDLLLCPNISLSMSGEDDDDDDAEASLKPCKSAHDLHEAMMEKMKKLDEQNKRDGDDDDCSVVSFTSVGRKRKKERARKKKEREAKKEAKKREKEAKKKEMEAKKEAKKKEREALKKKKKKAHAMVDAASVTSISSISSISSVSSLASIKSIKDKAKNLRSGMKPSLKFPKLQVLKERLEFATQTSGDDARDGGDDDDDEGEIKITYHHCPKGWTEKARDDPPVDDGASFVCETRSLDDHHESEGFLSEVIERSCLAVCFGGAAAAGAQTNDLAADGQLAAKEAKEVTAEAPPAASVRTEEARTDDACAHDGDEKCARHAYPYPSGCPVIHMYQDVERSFDDMAASFSKLENSFVEESFEEESFEEESFEEEPPTSAAKDEELLVASVVSDFGANDVHEARGLPESECPAIQMYQGVTGKSYYGRKMHCG